ncbi:DUF1453 domain-containing protein [Streptomyces sp. NPDC048290]|uniref:DUF1453 domain-containing protein n=1 Tax=Streptomyces sp. NPDC048290 TaxID=3155811 RepID=UPI00343ED224
MTGLVNALVIVAVVALVITRQTRPQRIDTSRRWWLVPAVLVFLSLRDPGVIDARHHTEAVLLLVAELLVGVAIGAGWAWTTRTWVETDGSVWSKSTKASLGVWGAGIAVRVALFGLGGVLGVHQGTPTLLLALAATLLVRGGILAFRAQALTTSGGGGRAYRDDGHRTARKERT